MRKRTARGRLHRLDLSCRSARHLCFPVICASLDPGDLRIFLPRRAGSQSPACDCRGTMGADGFEISHVVMKRVLGMPETDTMIA
jgi:hypothetical protein